MSECTRVMITLFTVSRAHLQHNYIVRMNKQYTVIVRALCTGESLYEQRRRLECFIQKDLRILNMLPRGEN